MKKLLFLSMLIISTFSYGQTIKDIGYSDTIWMRIKHEPCRVVKDLYWSIKVSDRFGEKTFIEYNRELVKDGWESEEYMDFGLFLIDAAKRVYENTKAKYPREVIDVHYIYNYFGSRCTCVSIEEAKERINEWFSQHQDK